MFILPHIIGVTIVSATPFFDMYMHKRVNKNKYTRLSRFPDALIPAALLAASILGQGKRAMLLYLCAIAVHMLSLGASHGIRAAFARQTTVKAVRGSVMCAITLQLTGFIILLFLSYLNCNIDLLSLLPVLVAGLSLNIEHMFYEYLYAMGDLYSAVMCHGLTALFTLTGLLLDAGRETTYCVSIAAVISAAVSFVISATIHGLSGRINAQVIKCAPRAMVYSASYPFILSIMTFFLRDVSLSVPFFSGLIIYELCRTPYRRSSMESRLMNRFLFSLSVIAGICMIVSFCFYEKTAPQAVFLICGAVIASSICSFVMFGRI